MVICIEIKRLTLPPSELKTYKGLLRLASAIYQRPETNIKIYFQQGDAQTQIESDDDLMALKYMLGKENITFKVQLSKTQTELELQMVEEVVDEFLEETYDEVVEEEFMREMKENITNFLDVMYSSISLKQVKEAAKQVKKDTVSAYLNRMSQDIIDKFAQPKRIPTYKRTNRAVRVSPEKELFRRKESQVESMVSRILESMMPVMVKELSYRIIEELKESQNYFGEYDPNPQEL